MYTSTAPAAWDPHPPIWSPQNKGASPQAVVLTGPLEHPTPLGLRRPPTSSPGAGKEAMELQKAIPEKTWKFWKTGKICLSRERPMPFVTHTKSHYPGYGGDSQESPDVLQGFPSQTTFLRMDVAHNTLYHWPRWGYPLKGFLNVQIQDYSIVW